MDDVELILRASAEGLWAVEGGSGRRLELPLSFWRELGESLRRAGHAHLAEAFDRAAHAAQLRERRLAEKLQCMEPAYDQEAQARCQILLEEDLRPRERG